MLRSAQICKKCTILGNLRSITQEVKNENKTNETIFHSTFWALTVCDYSFLYFKIVKIHFHGVLLSSILVCKIYEFWKCNLSDQNFVSFDSGSIPGFIFSIELRTKFVWSHSLILPVSESYFFIVLKLGFEILSPFFSE